MADQLAQTYLNTHYPNPAGNSTITKIDGLHLTGADKLTGELIIKNYPLLTDIRLEGQKFTKLVIINCPSLKNVNVNGHILKEINLEKTSTDNNKEDGNPVDNKMEELRARGTKHGVDLLNLKNCKQLKQLLITDNGKVTKVKGMKDKDLLDVINKLGTTGVTLVSTDDLEQLEEIKKFIKDELGVDFKKDGSGWKDTAKGGAAKALQTELDKVKKDFAEAQEKLEAQKDYEETKQERDQLKQNLETIKNELSLGNNSNQQQIIDKIKSLMGSPTSCTHTDYNAIKSERDSLKSENDQLKNNNNNIITGKMLADASNKWGIKLSNTQKNQLRNASSVKEVETVRNGIIKTEFVKLKDKNGSSAKLNVVLGVLAIGSLLILCWVLMKQTNLSLPEKPKKEKK